jgi:putative nucleotidyltransferase with HDIG domain
MFRHSISVGICAYVLGRRNQINPNQAFLAGILHDVGKLALVSSYPEIYAEARILHQKEDILMVDAEQRVFGFDHAAIGAALCSHWHFPKEICDAIGGHHQLADYAESAQTPIAITPLMEVVHLANVIAHALNMESDMQSSVPRISEVAWTNLAGTKEKLVNDFVDMQGMYSKLAMLVNM